MHFKIISVGGDCRPFISATLASILEQTHDDYDVRIVDDAPFDPEEPEVVTGWCKWREEEGDTRWHYKITEKKQWQVQNQVEAIRESDPDDDDVIVWLDLDGDRFAHKNVLKNLVDYYSDGTLVTYGSYIPIPDEGTSSPATPIPKQVVRQNSLRKYILNGKCPFNHLRTMKAKVFKAIPEEYFFWEPNRWYEASADYIIMTAALELAGARYKYIPETLCFYNHDNPLADFRSRGSVSSACAQHFLRRPPLKPLKG